MRSNNPMKRVISFSLWGNDPKYSVGAIRNAKLAPRIYPGWICRYYIGSDVAPEVAERLASYPHCEVERMASSNWGGALWRFAPAGEEDVAVMISRDTDSRLNEREAEAVREWLSGDHQFHIMRDHPWHFHLILGGLWGAKRGCLAGIQAMIEDYSKENRYGIDQDFLRDRVYPIVFDSALVHDEFYSGNDFPRPRRGFEFVGQAFDEQERAVSKNYELLADELASPGCYTRERAGFLNGQTAR